MARRACAAAVTLIGCSGTTTPAPGQLMVVLETNGGVGTPLDFAKVDVVVTDERAKGQVVKNYALVPSQLPGTIAIVAGGASASPTKIEVFATDGRGSLRAYQAARVTIPTEGASMVRMKLEVACDGVFPNVTCPGGSSTCASSPTVPCRDDQACVAARCIPVQHYGPKELPPYDAARVSSCEPEAESRLCARRGVACGTHVLMDTCGAPRIARCGACAGEGSATSAAATGPGLDDCGDLGAETCARSPRVEGGTFFRGEDQNHPVTIRDFRLDAYEVTVGRFRKFVDASVAGWRPSPGSGKHTHLNGGAGLADPAGGHEAGWDAAWTRFLGAPSASAVESGGAAATTKADWSSVLGCGGTVTTWTNEPAANEKRPQNCLSWYDLYGFCIWDGGFLPSEAEWEYAAAGGSEERAFPWGSTGPGADPSLAIYGCYYNGTGSCSGMSNMASVGTAPAGAGRWKQFDLAGNVWEWNLDWYEPTYASPCEDCANVRSGSVRVFRGGSFGSEVSYVSATYRGSIGAPAFRYSGNGGRCARAP